MGIGRDNSKDVVSYVLGRYKPEEAALYNDFLKKGVEAVLEVLNNGIQKAMTIYNK